MDVHRSKSVLSLMVVAVLWSVAGPCSCGGGKKNDSIDSGIDSGVPTDTDTDTETETETEPDAGTPCSPWLLQMGGSFSDSVCDVVAQDDGSVVVLGSFAGTIVFGEGDETVSFEAAGFHDLFLAGFDEDASFLWATVVTGEGSEGCGDLTLLGDDLLISGTFFDNDITIGTGGTAVFLPNLSGSKEIFLASFSQTGVPIWARALTSDVYGVTDANHAALPDGTGFYAAGRFSGEVVFGGGEPGETTLVPTPDTSPYYDPSDIFVARYTTDGTLEWAKRLTSGVSWKIVKDVAVTAAGALYVVGTIDMPVVFGEGEVTEVELIGTQPLDAFLARVSSDGSFEWVNMAAGSLSEEPTGVKALSNGSAVFTGRFTASITFSVGTPEVTTLHDNSGGGDIFLARYSEVGELNWAVRAGGSSMASFGDVPNGLEVVNGNLIVVTGFIQGSATFGEGSDSTVIVGNGGKDLFTAVYMADGSLFDAWAGGGSLDDWGTAAATSGEHYFIAGDFQGMADFSGHCATEWLSASGPQDIFVGRYPLE